MQIAFTALATLALVACSNGGSSSTSMVEEQCSTTTSTPLDEASWSGPSEDDALSAIDAASPTIVSWDEMTLGESESTITVIPLRTTDPAQVVERSGGASEQHCRPGPELLLPMQFDVSIDSGAVTSTMTGTLAVGSGGTDELYIDGLGIASLDSAWQDQATSAYDTGCLGTSSELQLVIYDQPWTGAQVDIDVDGDGDGYCGMTLWRGHWLVE